MTTDAAPIRFEHVSKSFGPTLVLDDVDVEIRAGAVTALLGPNGAGKTTALRVLLGLERPDRGRALVNGLRYRELRFPGRHIGSLLDASWVHTDRAARAHLEWVAHASGIPTSSVEPALEVVELLDVADNPIGTFSLGMRQRLGIASTVLGDPSILVYDEPLSSLDQNGVEWMRRFLADQAARGRTVLVSTHMLDEVRRTADDIVVIGRRTVLYAGPLDRFGSDDGPIVEVDLVDESGAVPSLRRLAAARDWTLRAGTERPGATTINILGSHADEVAAVLCEHGIAVRRIEDGGSLVDAYVRLTGADADLA